MSNDLERYSGGGVQPYAPSPQPLVPTAEDNWGDVPDYLSERQSSTPQLFGQDVPGATTQEQLQQALTEISAVISSDLLRLGDSPRLIATAVDWLKQNAAKTPQKERIAHRFNLYQYQQDIATNNWANAMARAGANQTFVDHCLWLADQLAEKIGEQQIGANDQPGTAPNSDPLDSLSDAEYERVIAINNKAAAETMGYLHDLWGQSFQSNLRMVQEYFQNLPAREQDHLGQMTTGWIAGTNTREVLLGLYQQAIGGGNIPTGGAALQDEIAACEACMKYERKKWLSDERLQARYRHLLTLRDG